MGNRKFCVGYCYFYILILGSSDPGGIEHGPYLFYRFTENARVSHTVNLLTKLECEYYFEIADTRAC